MTSVGDVLFLLVSSDSQALAPHRVLVASLAPAPLPACKGLGMEPDNLLDYWHLEMEVYPLLSDLLFPVFKVKGKQQFLKYLSS